MGTWGLESSRVYLKANCTPHTVHLLPRDNTHATLCNPAVETWVGYKLNSKQSSLTTSSTCLPYEAAGRGRLC